MSDTTELINRMRLLEEDHEPEGWPAVQMKDISALCDAVEHLEEIIGLAGIYIAVMSKSNNTGLE